MCNDHVNNTGRVAAKQHSLHKGLRLTAIVLLFIVSFNALAAGYSFITDPSGRGLGISLNYLRQSAPFSDYFIPGMVLFTVIGVLGCFIAVWAILNQMHYPFFVLMQGCILVGWIAIQLLMVTAFHPLHLIVGLIGITLMVLGWLLNQKQITW